jgi:hypothetical protein
MYHKMPYYDKKESVVVIHSVVDLDPGSGAFLPQGYGIRIRDDFFPDPGSRISDPLKMTKIKF